MRNKLVDGSDTPQLQCNSSGCISDPKHKARVTGNIFRQVAPLSSKHQGHSSVKFPIGWEKRLSLWKGRTGAHDMCKHHAYHSYD